MRKTLVTTLGILLSTGSSAAIIEVNTSEWNSDLSPSSGINSSNDRWLRLHSNTPTKLSNSSGSLTSDFSLSGNFDFSGVFSPTYAYNRACARPSENSCNDDDVVGLVFGWQNADNHYRLGWSQGGVSDITGRTGLYLIKEENGHSNTIISWEELFWVDEGIYDFSIQRVGSDISINIRGVTQNVPGDQSATFPGTAVDASSLFDSNVLYSFSDFTFMNGSVGIYTESQTASFSQLSVNGTVLVSTPSTFVLFGLTFFAVRRGKKILAAS